MKKKKNLLSVGLELNTSGKDITLPLQMSNQTIK